MKQKEMMKDYQNQRHQKTRNLANTNTEIWTERWETQVLIAQQHSNDKIIERDMLSGSENAR